MKRYELRNEQWKQIEQLFPPERTGKRGRPEKDNRMMRSGMLWIVRSGAQSVYARFSKWRDDGTLEQVFHALTQDADMENLSIDSTCIKVHESANGGKKTEDKLVGRTRGGLNTKLHAVVDGLGNSVEFLLSVGNNHDCVYAVELLEKVELAGSNVLAGRAYGAQTIPKYISEHKANYVIPPKSNLAESWSVDWVLYKKGI